VSPRPRSESITHDYLPGLGYKLLQQSRQIPACETGLIVLDDGYLVFVKVKQKFRINTVQPPRQSIILNFSVGKIQR